MGNTKRTLMGKKSGGALVYVMIFMAMLFSLFLRSSKSKEIEYEYFSNYYSFIINEDETQRSKEYIMSDFNKYMKENLNEIKEKTIKNFFLEKSKEGMFTEGLNSVYYDTVQDVFKIKFHKVVYSFYPIIKEDNIYYKFK